MGLEVFIELMTKNNSRASKSNIINLKKLCEKSNAINIDNFSKYEIKRLYERYEELVEKSIVKKRIKD